MKPLVIYHKSDYDGIFSMQIAKKFLVDADYLGWEYGDPIPAVEPDRTLFMLDINVAGLMNHPRLIWIDHHATAIAKYPKEIYGYRVDGVGACRLVWQWFIPKGVTTLPEKDEYLNRSVAEPTAVRLAGEYDVWDHRGDGSFELQHGLDAQEIVQWGRLLDASSDDGYVAKLLADGKIAMQFAKTRNAAIIRDRGFKINWEGLNLLCLNTPQRGSLSFDSADQTGIDGLLAFSYNGNQGKWTCSLYHSITNKEHDLSVIASKYGGGGHKGACGFEVKALPFLS